MADVTAEISQESVAQQVILAEGGGTPLVFRIVKWWISIIQRVTMQRIPRVIAVVSLMCIPLPFLGIRFWSYDPLSAFWAVWLTACDSMIIVLSWLAWDKFLRAGETVGEMLRDVPDSQRLEFEKWYQRALHPTRQLVSCGCAALCVLWIALRLPSPIVERVPVTVISLLLSGFVAGHAVYFIIYTALFCRRISRTVNLRLTWNSPIDTPGLVSLSKATQFEAQLGMILFLLVAPPLIYAYVEVHSAGVRLLYQGAMLFPVLCIIIIGLIVQGWLAGPARQFKARTLESAAASIDELRGGRAFNALEEQDLSLVKERLEIYQLLSNTPESFFRADVITQYLASIAAARIPLIISFLVK